MIDAPLQKHTVVYILGLSHVGSTLLDMTIGSHPKFIGLGEIFQVIRPDFNRFRNNEQCSCGKKMRDCPFWGPTAKALAAGPSDDILTRYSVVTDMFQRIYGDQYTPVDSSKLPDALKILLNVPGVDAKVINLIRDVRAWTISRLDVRNKNENYYGVSGNYIKKMTLHYPWVTRSLKWIFPYISKMPVYYFWLWYLQSRINDRLLSNLDVSSFKVSYEELGMYPEETMAAIFDFLHVDMQRCFSTETSQSHVLIGNTKKMDSERRKGIRYDNRWLYRNEWLIPAAVFQNIMSYNTNEVYRNIVKKSIW